MRGADGGSRRRVESNHERLARCSRPGISNMVTVNLGSAVLPLQLVSRVSGPVQFRLSTS